MLPSISPHAAPLFPFARALVFLASFCLMTIEIVAGRVTAPYLGVSLYTWTSVIGAVLLGVTMGNYGGGWLADHGASRRTLGLSFAGAGLVTLFAPALARVFGPLLASSQWPLWLSSSVFALIVFFPAAFFLSTITPQVVKNHLRRLEESGMTVGVIGAWSAFGSIVGTFASGFLFIAFIGTKLLLEMIALTLLAIGIGVAWHDRMWKRRLTVFIAFMLLGELLYPSMCRMETAYYCLRTAQVVQAEGVTSTALYLDHLIHSYVTPGKPEAIGYRYEYLQAGALAYRFNTETPFSVLTIGGGGYSVPRYVASVYPRANVEVVEIDPGVTEFNHQALALPRDTRIRSFHQDARLFLQTLDPRVTYDVIYGDAVNDLAVPYQLTTQEFLTILKRHLSPGGIYALTVIDDPRHGDFLAAMIRTLQSRFTHVYVFPLGSNLFQDTGRNTFELFAMDEELDEARWQEALPIFSHPRDALSVDLWRDIATHLSSSDLEAFLHQHPNPVLTDDYAPVDAYLAPVFDEAYNAPRVRR